MQLVHLCVAGGIGSAPLHGRPHGGANSDPFHQMRRSHRRPDWRHRGFAQRSSHSEQSSVSARPPRVDRLADHQHVDEVPAAAAGALGNRRIRALAEARGVCRLESCRSSGVTSRHPAPLARSRPANRLPGRRRRACRGSGRPGPEGRARRGPAARSISGFSSRCAQTKAEAGLPGRPSTAGRRESARASRACRAAPRSVRRSCARRSPAAPAVARRARRPRRRPEAG